MSLPTQGAFTRGEVGESVSSAVGKAIELGALEASYRETSLWEPPLSPGARSTDPLSTWTLWALSGQP